MASRTLQIMVGGRIPVDIAGIAETQLEEFLDSGGSGSLWIARNRVTGEVYALKIIQGLVPDSVAAKRARREASVAISSDYVVKSLGLCEWDPSTYLILFEYFPGQALDKLITTGILTPASKKKIIHQILLGVADAHRHNVIHRDLKPANILVGDESVVKLIDFGISKFLDANVTRGETMGTFEYMAPDLIRGARFADARADIFAAGQVLYELAMGQSFWARRGWTGFADFLSFLNTTPPPTEAIDLDDFCCDFLSNADKVLARMVKLNPDERYDSIEGSSQ